MAFKPELGYSERWGKIVLDAYGGVWFYTTNPNYFDHNQFVSGRQSQSQKPIGTFEGHLSYDWKSRTWVSLDGNFWYGGITSLNGIANLETRQTGSRMEPQGRSDSTSTNPSKSATVTVRIYGSVATIRTSRSRGNGPGSADRNKLCDSFSPVRAF